MAIVRTRSDTLKLKDEIIKLIEKLEQIFFQISREPYSSAIYFEGYKKMRDHLETLFQDEKDQDSLVLLQGTLKKLTEDLNKAIANDEGCSIYGNNTLLTWAIRYDQELLVKLLLSSDNKQIINGPPNYYSKYAPLQIACANSIKYVALMINHPLVNLTPGYDNASWYREYFKKEILDYMTAFLAAKLLKQDRFLDNNFIDSDAHTFWRKELIHYLSENYLNTDITANKEEKSPAPDDLTKQASELLTIIAKTKSLQRDQKLPPCSNDVLAEFLVDTRYKITKFLSFEKGDDLDQLEKAAKKILTYFSHTPKTKEPVKKEPVAESKVAAEPAKIQSAPKKRHAVLFKIAPPPGDSMVSNQQFNHTPKLWP